MVENIHAIKDTSLPETKKSVISLYATSRVKRGRGLTRRMVLHQRYTREQIRYLSNIFYRFNYLVWAGDTSELVHYDRNHEVIQTRSLTPREQYDSYVAQLHVEMGNDARVSGIFSGAKIDFEDVVMAGLESGVIEGQMANDVLKIKEFWDPSQSKATKYLEIVKKYGSPAAILVPPPFNSFYSVLILFLETVVIKDHSKDPKSSDLGESLW